MAVNSIILKPIYPWYIIILTISITCILMLLLSGFIDRWRFCGSKKITRVLALGFSIIAIIFFIFSALNPHLLKRKQEFQYHLVVALDVSNSVLKNDKYERILKNLGKKIDSIIDSIPNNILLNATASIVTFGNGTAVTYKKINLIDLPNSIQKALYNEFAPGDETNIEEGIRHAGQLLEKYGEQGCILLISDGNQTKGDVISTTRRLSRQGIPIHVIPVECIMSGLRITAVNLPSYVKGEGETFLRGTLQNSYSNKVDAKLIINLNSGLNELNGKFNKTMTTTKEFEIPSNQWRNFRIPLKFDGYGLQFVDVNLLNQNNNHHRRLYINVKKPPKILAIGGDNRWISSFSKDVAEIFQIAPENLPLKKDLIHFDSIVISGISASHFSDKGIANIVDVVENNGTGLMFINGAYNNYGNNFENPTMLMSYEKTKLSKLLPVSSKPRPYQKKESPRNVVVMIDASGSMGGWRIEKSKEIAQYIVQYLLRDKDFLDLIVFTTGLEHKVNNIQMNTDGKAYAINCIKSISAGGGTDPTQALKLIADRHMNNCGLIFISDGDFNTVAFRPDCKATVFAVGHNTVPANSPLFELADPFAVNDSFSPYNIMVPYFNPKPREKFFEPGSFKPLPVDRLSKQFELLKVPDFYLEGAAVTYIKENSELIAVRPKFTDPILAYKEWEQGYVGVFTTEFTDEWFYKKQGKNAIKEWISYTIPFIARDRYNIKLTDNENSLKLKISIISKNNIIPAINNLSASILLDDKQEISIPLEPDSDIANNFNGEIRISRNKESQCVKLVIKESGADALPRPQQIPLLIPPAGKVDNLVSNEFNSYGINENLLKMIARISAGIYNPDSNCKIFYQKHIDEQGRPLWPWLIVIGAAFYLAAITCTRIDP